MFLITALSTAAIAFGIGANLPQIVRMSRARSAAGQSAIGWAMGAVTNLCLAYVNLVGLGALLLGVANLATVLLCCVAIALIRRFGRPVTIASPVPHPEALDAMLTQELALTREAVEAAQRRRDERRAAHRPVPEQDAVVAVA
ncbi:MAG: hypothetical protein AB7G37_02365 [Solirubrobacteraceae bacterium]